VVTSAFYGKVAMDKPIWEQIQEDAKSFGEVLELASKLIAIKRKAITYARAIDVDYETTKKFTLNDWKALHKIGISLWYKQYSISLKSLKLNDFTEHFLPKYQEVLNSFLQKYPQLIQLQDIESLRRESLNIWKDFMAELACISYQEQVAGKKPKKLQLNPDSQFAILAVVALILGILLAIVVSFIRR